MNPHELPSIVSIRAISLLCAAALASPAMGGCDPSQGESFEEQWAATPRSAQATLPGFDLSITVAGDDIELSWDAQANTTYQVWRSADPYFALEDASATLLAEQAATTLSDAGAGSDSSGYYYRVRAVNADGSTSDSTTVGKHAFPLETGYNKIGLSLVSDVDTAAEIIDAVGSSVISVHRWDAAAQQWIGSAPADPPPGIDFSLGQSVSLNVDETHPAQYVATGRVPAPGEVDIQLYPGINIVTMMPFSVGFSTASELLAAVPGATSVGNWDAATQSLVSHPTDGDFGLEPGMPIEIVTDQGSSWPLACTSDSDCGSNMACSGTGECLLDPCVFAVPGSECIEAPSAPVLALGYSPIKHFDFSWAPVPEADYYQLEQSASPGEPFVPIGGDIEGESVSLAMPLHLRYEASYRLRACNAGGCTESDPVDVVGSLAEAAGYFKGSNTGWNDQFGHGMALSKDGNTLAIGAPNEDGSATGIGGAQDDARSESGAVYVFARDGAGQWSQQAYVKASNAGAGDQFGQYLTLSDDGDTLAVSAIRERSDATGVDGDQSNDHMGNAGAAYVFVRDGAGQWSQQAYVKASNTNANDEFGREIALSGDGNTLVVGAPYEDGNATGINGNQQDNATPGAGAAYVYTRDVAGQWAHQAYIKGPSNGWVELFGISVALDDDGDTLVVGAPYEDSNATGIDGDPMNNSLENSGAAYVFVLDEAGQWSQDAYVKASNTGSQDNFGWSVALSSDGDTLAVGAMRESSGAAGIDGDQGNNTTYLAGAVYVYERDEVGNWSQDAYVKASNPGSGDYFGWSVSLNDDGSILAVGATGERSNATGLGGDQGNDGMTSSGATYVFSRDQTGDWLQDAYVKAPNTGTGDEFGRRVALSGDGGSLAVCAWYEDGNATGIGGDQGNDSATSAGAVYLY